MNVLVEVAVMVACYLCGAIPVGLLLTRVATGKDIRQVGSGRTGATNVLRGAGPAVAALTILGDGLKGFLAVLLARTVLKTHAAEAVAGLMVVIGHNYSIFINFRGGAGTVATIGGAIGLWPWCAAILVFIGTGVIAATRYASLASIVIALVVPLVMALRAWQAGAPWIYMIFGLGTSLLTLWALRPNIKRLLEGCERRVTIQTTPY